MNRPTTPESAAHEAEGMRPPVMSAAKRMALFFAGPFITMAYAAMMPMALFKLWREEQRAAAQAKSSNSPA